MTGWKNWLKARFGTPRREKRKNPRKPFQVKVTNLHSGFFTYYRSRDISAGGMFLEAAEPLPAGTPLDLQFTLPGASEPVTVSAEVVRAVPAAPDGSRPLGMGIRFRNLPADLRRRIKEFVEMPG